MTIKPANSKKVFLNETKIPASCKENRKSNIEQYGKPIKLCVSLDKSIPITYSTTYDKDKFYFFINNMEYEKFKKVCLYTWQEKVPLLFQTTKKNLDKCKTDYINAYEKMYDYYKNRFDQCKQNGKEENICKTEIKNESPNQYESQNQYQNESQAGGLIDDKYYKKYLKYKNKYIQLKKMNLQK